MVEDVFIGGQALPGDTEMSVESLDRMRDEGERVSVTHMRPAPRPSPEIGVLQLADTKLESSIRRRAPQGCESGEACA